MWLGGYATAEELLSAPKRQKLELTLAAHNQQINLAKAPGESAKHLLLKALLWAAIVQTHDQALCEPDNLPYRYKPDVVVLHPQSHVPVWWGECGSVSTEKLRRLTAALPDTRFSIAKWGRSDLRGYAASLRRELELPRRAPIDVISFPDDSASRFLDEAGNIDVTIDELIQMDLMIRL